MKPRVVKPRVAKRTSAETQGWRNTRVAKHKGGETTGVETKGGETHECRNPNGAELFYQLPDAKSLFSCWSNPLDCNRDFFPIRVRPKSFPKNGSGTSLIKGYPSLFEGGLYLGDLDSFWINEGRNASFFEAGRGLFDPVQPGNNFVGCQTTCLAI